MLKWNWLSLVCSYRSPSAASSLAKPGEAGAGKGRQTGKVCRQTSGLAPNWAEVKTFAGGSWRPWLLPPPPRHNYAILQKSFHQSICSTLLQMDTRTHLNSTNSVENVDVAAKWFNINASLKKRDLLGHDTNSAQARLARPELAEKVWPLLQGISTAFDLLALIYLRVIDIEIVRIRTRARHWKY